MNQSETKGTILLVDDDADFLFQLQAQFAAEGYEVLTAGSGKEAIGVLAQTRPDLCIVDLMMEKADMGFTLCYKIKKKDPTIPVIMVTSVTHETGIDFDAATLEERCWIKADALLDKPVRFEQLQREIARLLKG
ncbi:MAG: response regulator [Candidatus Hydrogenedentes bacterium]|nr:response regulator [Candidatus Hydrogenedentota bacterium]